MSRSDIDVRSRLEEIDKGVMEGLTPFQRATVEHIARLYENDHRRVLVADEVGLGKTLIARGVISKLALLREREQDDLVKIAYICSNASIAAQNIAKLQIDGDISLSSGDDSRLSMQHLKLAQERTNEELRKRYIQITPLTPATSFNIASGEGTMHERALMGAVLLYDQRFCGSQRRMDGLKKLMWHQRADSNEGYWNWLWQERRKNVLAARRNDHDPVGRERYPYDVLESVSKALDEAGEYSLESICGLIDEQFEAGWPRGERWKRTRAILALRRAFSKAAVDMLQPDLVIMDEFQRFRDLIDTTSDSESSLLAQRFLGGTTRVLLLSATPFRMYSTDAELDTMGFDDSYSEFLKVMDFLGGAEEGAHEEFSETWGNYTISLRSLGSKLGDVVSIQHAKSSAEHLARNYMVRTERQSTGELGAIADNSSHVVGEGSGASGRGFLKVSSGDIEAYVRMRDLLGKAEIRRGLMSVDFVKSCPFPLSFMSDYKLFKELEKEVKKRPNLISARRRSDGGLLWLRSDDISSYGRLRVENARYQALLKDLTGDTAVKPERLLWVPASKPYYRPSYDSPYANSEGFSKMLVFSSWAMVPRALSCLLSYEFERENVNRLQGITHKNYRYFKDGERDADESRDSQALPYRRIRFESGQHNAFLLVYPSRYLASLVDVHELASQDMSLAELRRSVRRRIAEDLPQALGLKRLPRRGEAGQRSSIDWYVMAAVKLDELNGHDVLGEILSEEGRAKLGFGDAYKAEESALREIAQQAATWEPRDLGRYPEDLLNVLTDAAIGSPAVCALRTYAAYADQDVPAWMAFQLGDAFVNRMNTSSATLTVAAVMEGERKRKEDPSAQWKNLLDYSCEGNLQAVLDEYAYMQRPMDERPGSRRMVEKIHRAIVGPGTMPNLRNVETRYEARVPNRSNARDRIGRMNMRTNIAAAFMESKTSYRGKDEVVSRANLREAFNSPFRPFVLVSTSVGQEGLDFHKYCRKICHWNLPSNPIDLEQREGRVNRYQGLSVRQSIAARYGAMAFSEGPVWKQLFEMAEREELERGGERAASGLLPNWGVSGGENLVPVERYAYLYPFSRDEVQYRRLLEQVRNYRMVLGQPDQEELLGLLRERVEDGTLSEEELRDLYVNLCPFVWEREEGEA